MQSHSVTEVEIDSLQSQQRPDADVYQPDSGNYAMAHGCGLDPCSHRVLEHGTQQQRSQAYDQRGGNRSEPPTSPAGSKREHPRKDATAGSRAGCRRLRVADGVDQVRFNRALRVDSGPLNIGAAPLLRIMPTR
jgi:hypothetical protein